MLRRVLLRRFATVAAYTSPSPSVLRPSSSALSSRLADSYHHTTPKPIGYVDYHRMQYSTSVPNDPDTHEDFMPTRKVKDSESSLIELVEQDVKEHPVMLYMKGIPEAPRCGFSSLAVRVLNEYNVPVGSRNILEDPELKDAVKAVSQWPTFPQIFIKGEFIGGSDIILNMHQNFSTEQVIKKGFPKTEIVPGPVHEVPVLQSMGEVAVSAVSRFQIHDPRD